jgi:class 3 adenylate cyclase
LFADLVGFTEVSTRLPARQLVAVLNDIFSMFDILAQKLRLEKLKTIGDAYMAVAGLPERRDDHAEAAAEMALGIQSELKRFNAERGTNFAARVGIHTGPVVAGIIGRTKFSYDLWGDTANVASRMESHGVSGEIQVSEKTHSRLKDKYDFEERGFVTIKGKGQMKTFLLYRKNALPVVECASLV